MLWKYKRMRLITRQYGMSSFKKRVRDARSNGKQVHGIKEKSVLSNTINVLKQCPIDYMHCVLCVMKKLMKQYWFKNVKGTLPLYINTATKKIKYFSRLNHSEFHWSPQSIDKYLSHALLLFYSLPILKDFLPPTYFYHLSLPIHLLHCTKISMKDISKAESMLFELYTLAPNLYSLDMCTHITHSLIHLTKCECNLGPLWCYSMFEFE